MLQDAAAQLERKGIHAILHEPKEEIPFRADERLLSAALMTLVSNSLRHAGADVQLTLSAERVGNSVSFGVQDNGQGLSQEALESINSWQKPDAILGSWGLGIPYARRIAAMHGGMLLFLRGQSCGTSAYIRIPLHTAELEEMESGSDYQPFLASDIGTADVELSDALNAAAFRKAAP